MTGKISGLLLLAVGVAMLLIGNQLIALVSAAAGVLFLLYSVGGRHRHSQRRYDGFWSAGGGAVGSDNNGCDNGNSTGDSGCGGGGDGGGGGD